MVKRGILLFVILAVGACTNSGGNGLPASERGGRTAPVSSTPMVIFPQGEALGQVPRWT